MTAWTVPLGRRLLLAAVTAGLFVLPDLFAGLFNSRVRTVVPPSTAALLLLAGLLVTSLPPRHARAAVLFLCTLQLVALAYLCYFGRSLSAREVPFLVREWDEVAGMGWRTLGENWYVPVGWGAALAGLLWVAGTGKGLRRTRWAWLGLATVAFLPARPYRSRRTELSVSVASPYWPSIRTGTNAFAWLVARGASPGPPGPAYAPYQVRRRAGPPARHVVLAVADSCSTRFMSLYGFGEPTTPLLETWRADPDFVFRRGLSGSIASLASMRVLLNLVREPGNADALWFRRTNLVRLAREGGYATTFLSAQAAKNTALAGPEFADLAFHEDGPPGSPLASGRDDALLATLKTLPLGERSFVVLHQRNLHHPYEENTQRHPECLVFPEEIPFGRYRNAMLCYDRWVDALFRWCREHLDGESYVFLTSDHGEAFGDGGVYGHGTLDRRVADVPAMVLGIHPDPAFMARFSEFKVLTHHDLGLLVADRLGFEIVNPNAEPGSYVVQDINIERGTRYVPVRVTAEGATFLPARAASETGK